MAYNLSIPVFTERRRTDTESAPTYVAQPVFVQGFRRDDPIESRALSQLEKDLRRHLAEHGGDPQHHLPIAWSFTPELVGECVRVLINLRKSHQELNYFLVRFRAFDRWVCFNPKIPSLQFEVRRGQNLVERAGAAFSEFFRKSERAGEKLDPADYASTANVRLGQVEVECLRKQRIPEPQEFEFASIGSSESMSGPTELERVGRNLNRLFPHGLEKAILRDREVSELTRAITDPDRTRPIMLVGPSLVGKTTIIHEFLRRFLTRHDEQEEVPVHPGGNRGKKKKKKKKSIKGVWLLDPQRLISGMAFVGQWEERLHVIIKEIRKQRHVMYIDDIIGFFECGKTSDSDLTLGNVLKAQHEEAPFNLLAETTPEGWRRFREIDRGFADQFKVIRIPEPGTADTVRIIIQVMRGLETGGTRFLPGALAAVMDLQQRFGRGRAFPGKAAEFLRQLAANNPGMPIDEFKCHNHFKRKTGVATVFVESFRELPRSRIENYFQRRIVGQEAATSAMVDVISLSKARLNDPGRPMASLLFLGPTGVGKTECAKALAEYIFGSAERMIRLDMNEFVSADAAARLIGFRGHPHGLLTSAIRRQPYTVLLLDEIEKADPGVFDLLLQVLGEGRLTDAAGQTADFCNAVVILTSNLGAKDQRSKIGFGADGVGDAQIYLKAAENFFRPELFNRLDRVIPFHALTREHIAGMVSHLANRALERTGIARRNLMLDLKPEVFAMLAEKGFDKQYGARALRRAVEDHLVQPIADILTKQPPGRPSTITVGISESGEITITKAGFIAPETVSLRKDLRAGEIEPLCSALDKFLSRVGQELDGWDISEETDHALRAHYYFLREELIHLRTVREKLLRSAEAELNPRNRNTPRRQNRFGRASTRLVISDLNRDEVIDELTSSGSPSKVFARMAASADIVPTISYHAENLIRRANRIHFFVSQREESIRPIWINFGGNEQEIEELLYSDITEGSLVSLADVGGRYIETFNLLPGGDTYITPDGNTLLDLNRSAIYTDVPLAQNLMKMESGSHMVLGDDGTTHNFQIGYGLAPDDSPPDADGDHRVLRIFHQSGYTLDLRTGIITEKPPSDLWGFINPLLPCAPEFSYIADS